MRQRWYQLLVPVLLASVLVAPFVLAGNGKLSGVVKAADGTPAVGANVVLEGTPLGASADVNGRYFILNVSPGTYRVRASAVGFTPKVITGVLVEQDQIVTLDFTLQSEAVGLAEVVVQAERPIVDKSLTASKSTLTSEAISSLPINNQVGILATSASAFNGFIRGGRITEAKTVVDGVDLSDQYYAFEGDVYHTPYRTYNNVPRYMGSEVSRIGGNFSLNSVEQVSVNTGAVGAEYSSASSGIVSYSMREGRGALTGAVSARVSQFNGLRYGGPDPYNDSYKYFAEKTDMQRRVDSLRARRSAGLSAPTLPTDSIRLGWYTYENGKYVTEKPELDFQASLGGDIMKDWGFYFTGKYFESHGRLPGEFAREVNLTLKTQYNFTGDIKLTALGILTDRGQLFGWKNRGYADQARFFLEGVPKYDGTDIVGMLKLTHVLNPASFYEVQASYTSNSARTGYSDDNGDGKPGYYEEGDFIHLTTLAQANSYISNSDLTRFFRNQDEPLSTTSNFFVVGNALARLARPAFFYEDLLMSTLTVKGDYTNQINANHRLQAGVQGRFQNLDMKRQASFLGAVDAKQQYYEELWNPKPTEIGGYLQDRMEYAGLIINVGVRVDSWNPDAQEFTNYFAPYLDQKVPVDTLPGVTTLVTKRITQRSKDVGSKVYWSPRLGVSHPISDVAAMYFSYSRNMTPPPYSRMFSSYNNFGNTSLPNNPSVKQQPYMSNNYELGVQWEFVPKFGLNFNAFMRDIENYGYTAATVIPRSGPYGTTYGLGYTVGYADSRGVELTLDVTRQAFFDDFLNLTAKATYAYSYIKASGLLGPVPDKNNQTTFSTAGGDSARLGGDLPLNDLIFYNKVETNVSGGQSTLTGGFDRQHRITYQIVLEFPYDILLSSVGSFQSGFYYPLTLPQSVADSRLIGREYAQGPWNKRIDLRLEKGFTLGGIRLAIYADAVNVANWTNIVGFDNTAASGTLEWETKGNPAGTLNRPVGTDGTAFYGPPREFYFGARVNF